MRVVVMKKVHHRGGEAVRKKILARLRAPSFPSHRLTAFVVDLFSAVALALLLLIVAASGEARAWGREGHRIVADIAERYLAPDATRQVQALLALENATSLVDIADWAEEIRRERRETARWHYVNIPVHPPAGTAAAYDAARDCPEGNCLVAATERFIAVLADGSATPAARLEALKFVVHFVGNLHQPLDCADNDDRGGNDVRIYFSNQHMTLHGLWDWGLLAPAVGGRERAYADRLAAAIDAKDVAPWQQSGAADWANESFRLARALIYGEMKPEARTLAIFQGSEYLPVIDAQLEKAGVRLAGVVNRALR
jgi:S1/P1 Nuclease